MLRKLWKRRSSVIENNDVDGIFASLKQAQKGASPDETKRLIACINIASGAMSYREEHDMRKAFDGNENFRELEPDNTGAPRFDDLKSGLQVVVAKNFLELQVIQPNPESVLPEFVDMVEKSLIFMGSRTGPIADGRVPKSREFELSVLGTGETAKVAIGPTKTPFRTTSGETLDGLIVLILIEKPRTN